MPFPTSINGTILIATRADPENSIAPVRAAYKDWLVSNRASSIEATPLGLSFRAGIFRLVGNWNILGPISSGEIDVAADGLQLKVAYRLRCTEVLVVASVMAAFLFVVAAIGTGKLLIALAISALGFAWLFGMNYLIAYLRLSRALSRLARNNAD